MRSAVLHRYVLRELVGPFFAALGVLLTLFYAFVLVRGVEFLLGSGATPGDWVTLGFSLLPVLLPQVLPIALMLGVMIGFARLGEDRELTALSSVGVSPAALAVPAVLLAVLVSAVLGLTLFVWKPWGLWQLRATTRGVIERNLLGDLKPNTVRADLPGVVFHAVGVAPGPAWSGVLLIDERDAERVSVLSAPRAKATFERGVGIEFSEGVLLQRDGDAMTTTAFDEGTLLLNVAEALTRRNTLHFGSDNLSPPELNARAEMLAARGDKEALLWRASFHQSFAQLLAPFALGLLAVALALRSSRRGVRGAALTALGVYLFYFVAVRVGVQLGGRAVISAVAGGYGPTLAILLMACALLWRVTRRGLG